LLLIHSIHSINKIIVQNLPIPNVARAEQNVAYGKKYFRNIFLNNMYAGKYSPKAEASTTVQECDATMLGKVTAPGKK
jgi:hypothetical protein